MNIVSIVDKEKSAIWNLAEGVRTRCPHFNIQVLPFHPKRPSVEQAEKMAYALEKADMLDVMYWKSGEKVAEMFPKYWKDKRKILTHCNPYDVHAKDWEDYKYVVVKNESQRTDLPSAFMIPITIDLDFYKFNQEYTEEKTVNMTVARIEGKKGVREVAEICKRNGYKFLLVGRVSNSEYMDQVKEAAGDMLEFHENCSNEELRDVYYKSAIHVCNSVDDFESGTMPILEAMACGVPVVTRSVGHVPDIYNGKNLELFTGQPNEIDRLEKIIVDVMDNYDLRVKRRRNGWDTVKNRGHIRSARLYSGLFYKLMGMGRPLVSVIIPTYNRHDSLIKSLAAIEAQDYPNKEIVVADSGSDGAEEIIKEFGKNAKTPTKYVRFQREGYTLAEARNRAVIESEGDFLLFCDDRLQMDKGALAGFSEMLESRLKSWLWGTKDGNKKSFVENFSCIRRKDFIEGGMFSERIDKYGGTTQEIRSRFEKQGYAFVGVDGVNAREIKSSKSKWNRLGDIIESKDKLFKMYG